MLFLIFLLTILCSMEQGIFCAHNNPTPSMTLSSITEIANGYLVNDDELFITPNEHKELQIEKIIEKLRHTKTDCGTRGLRLLLKPTAVIDTILHRQKVIKELATNNTLQQSLQDALIKSARYEQAVASYWNTTDPITVASEALFFSPLWPCHNLLNNNQVTLELGMAMETSKSVLTFLQSICLDGLKNNVLHWWYGQGVGLSLKNGIIDGLKDPIRNHNPWQELTKESGYPVAPYVFAQGTFGDRVELVTQLLQQKQSSGYIALPARTGGIMVSSTYMVLYDLYMIYLARKSYDYLKTLHKSITQLRHRLMLIQLWIEQVYQLHAIIKKNDVVRTTKAFTILDDFIKERTMSEDFKKLHALLTSNTFNQHDAHVYFRGKVLLAQQLLLRTKHELIPLFEAVGELDAYNNLALLCNQTHSTHTPPYSFVTFLNDQNTPYLDVIQGISPIIDSAHGTKNMVVANSICLGGTNAPHCIITGPNGCGKSILTKLIGHIVFFAQSCGIAPAEHVSMTCLHGIRTCFVSKENVEKQLSTFASELKRMHTLAMYVKDMGNNNHLILADEPYRGAIPSMNAQVLYDFFTENLLTAYHTVSCIATHCEQPITLALQYPDIFVNKQMQVTITPECVQRMFVLTDGPATWWFTDSAKQHHYIEWFKQHYTSELS